MHEQHSTRPEPNASTPSSESASGASGGDVMKILSDFEGQLQRLRSAQRTQDDTIASLSQRSKALQQAEDESAKLRRELESQRQVIERERQQLQSQREQFEAQSRKIEDQLRQQQAQTSQERKLLETEKANLATQGDNLRRKQTEVDHRAAELNERQAQFDLERERVAALQKQCQQQLDLVSSRSQQFETERKELSRRVEQAESNVGTLIKEVEQSQQQLAHNSEQLQAATAEISGSRSRVRELEKAVQDAAQRAEQTQREIAEQMQASQRERYDLAQKLKGTSMQLQQMQTARDVAAAELEKAQKARDAARTELEHAHANARSMEQELKLMQSKLVEREAQAADSRHKLDTAGRKLTEFAQILAEQTPQLERGAAAVAMVQQQQDQIERLTKQLAETTLRSDPEEMQRKEQRIHELTEALRQARGQSAEGAGFAELEQRNAQLAAQLDQMRLEARDAQLAAEEARRQLHEQASQQGAQAMQDSSLAEHVAKIASLTQELERIRASNAAEINARVEEETRKHKKQSGESGKSDTKAVQKLQARVAELEEQLRDAESRSQSGSSDDQGVQLTDLRAKAEKVGAVAEHLRRRRARLWKYKHLLERKQIANAGPSSSEELRAEQQQQIDNERAQLAEVRRMLTASEQEMIRRWARPRAALTIASIVFMMVVCAVGSWVAVCTLFPPKVSASVVLEAQSESNTPLSDEEAQSWRDWHVAAVSDPGFQQTLSKRMAERRLDQYGDAKFLGSRLKRDLTIDAQQDSLLILSLAGDDPDDVISVLDVLTATLTTESARSKGRRADNAVAVAPAARKDGGRIRYARLNEVPISDVRLTRALPIFGVSFLVCLLFILIAYTRLARAQRVFDQESAVMR